jgi:predicted RNA binding protein YcfA (HicA-like mRNA interferase family)
MPSATARELQTAARKLGFSRTRQTGSHERWNHPDGRAVTIPLHGGREIGPPLFFKILRQLGISLDEFQQLRQTKFQVSADRFHEGMRKPDRLKPVLQKPKS